MTKGVEDSERQAEINAHSFKGTFFNTTLPMVIPTYVITSMMMGGPWIAILQTFRILSGENSNPAKNKMKNTPNSPIVST